MDTVCDMKEGRKNPDSESLSYPHNRVLPPCRVCGQKSSGFHYGANTCEACKGFFRRTLKKKEVTFICSCTDNTRVEDGSQLWTNTCPLCRYKRCVAVGMSRQGIKIGRYSLTRQTQNIKEVKKMECLSSDLTDALEWPSSPLLTKRACDILLDSSEDSGHSTPDSSTNSPLDSLDTRTASAIKTPQKSQKLGVETFDVPEEEMETVIQSLVDAQADLADTNIEMDKKALEEHQKEFAEEYKLKTGLFGPMKLSQEEYLQFYKTTGIDIDSRQEIIKECLDFLEKKAVKIVQFATTIPGFTDIPIDDQANLIKAARLEFSFYGWHNRYTNPKLKVITTHWGRTMHMDQIKNIVDANYVDFRFVLAKKFQNLQLSHEECALMRAIAMTFSDRPELELQCPDKVEAVQWKLVTCLRYLLNKQGRDKGRLAKLLATLYPLRDLTSMGNEVARTLYLEMPVMQNHRIAQEYLGFSKALDIPTQ